jgi:hypothetical protein
MTRTTILIIIYNKEDQIDLNRTTTLYVPKNVCPFSNTKEYLNLVEPCIQKHLMDEIIETLRESNIFVSKCLKVRIWNR